MENVNHEVSIDLLYREYAKIAREKAPREPSGYAHTGKILPKIGRYTIISHVYIDCLMCALNDCPKTCWQLAFYFIRHIHGIGRNKRGDPKTYMNMEYVKITDIIRKAKIKSVNSYYKAMKTLEERRIIFFKEIDGDRCLFCNIFPLTWSIGNGCEGEIREMVESEIRKIRENGNNEDIPE